MKNTLIIMFLLSVFANILYARTISGVVSNKTNGQPIEFASIVIKETEQGAYSNNRGYFVIPDVRPGNYTIYISHISFNTHVQEVAVTLTERNPYVRVELAARSIQMEDVTVVGRSEQISINTREIVISHVGQTTKQLLDVVQVAEPDIFRSILTLPGVTPVADFSSGMYVRGGSPDQNQILLDDIEVYNPTHFGGLFSTFNTDAVNSVELLKGGFPAKYGGRLSSVLDVRNRDGNRKQHEGVARLSLLSLSGTVEGPWKLGSQTGSYMGSYRRSYLDLMRQFISLIPKYYFYDGHVKANWDIGNKDRLMVSSYFGYDKLNLGLGSMGLEMGWGNRTFTAQWVHIFNPQLYSHFVIANSHFESEMKQTAGDNSFVRDNFIDDITVKAMMSYRPNNSHMIDFGLESKFNGIKFSNTTDFDISENSLPNVNFTSVTNDIYIQDTWTISPIWTLQPGIRVSNYLSLDFNLPGSPDANYTRISPRVSLRKRLTVDSISFISYGRYYQFLTLASPGISTPLDIWLPIDGSVKPGEADHYIFGYKHELTEGIGLDIEFYYKDMRNLAEYNMETDQEWDNATGKLADIFYIGIGDARGIDLLLRTDKWGWTGFLGYGYCITRRKMEGKNLNPQTGKSEYYFPRYDRNHQVNIVQAYDMTEHIGIKLWGANQIFGITYTLASGQPTAVPEKIYFAGDHFNFLYSYSDSERLPHYSRLDVSYKMQWIKPTHTIETYLQIINLLNRKNVFSRNYVIHMSQTGDLSIRPEDSYQFPLIPFIGINVNW